ncbi:DUF1569 domain-containing protein [Dyadobacter jiangsuensis]|uniref:Uncharacterized protein DUF1569 n=1 Tax=Dyadobacter jiangsuensis TaxID=1591085 RepID=A0A2P8GIX8_9BACT|nr:DUF1569 domain-containing protein [Dyadobacter jiangsuensis]PSL33918.1 uncharacterized protein DUF1569 [Dyadobacter jiangsuensis]
MKTIFDAATRDELIRRIRSLETSNAAQWGKMNVYQMTRHCTIWDEWVLGVHKPKYKQELMGWIFGRMALKTFVKDDRPIQKNVPTGRMFIVKELDGDLEQQKQIWIRCIAAYEHFSNPDFIHDFFGKMTREQIGIFAYKHSDHHLRQFGAVDPVAVADQQRGGRLVSP